MRPIVIHNAITLERRRRKKESLYGGIETWIFGYTRILILLSLFVRRGIRRMIRSISVTFLLGERIFSSLCRERYEHFYYSTVLLLPSPGFELTNSSNVNYKL